MANLSNTISSTATATFKDCWFGEVPAFVAPFRTKRRGETVIRYRWQRRDGLHCCRAVFASVERAAAVMRTDQRFSDVVFTGQPA